MDPQQTILPEQFAQYEQACHQEEVMRAMEQQAWRRFCMWRHDAARELAERLMYLAPERAWPHYLLGEIAGRLQRWEEALEAYMKAIALGRRDPETLLRASESAMKLRRVQEAARWMAAAAAHPDIDAARKQSIHGFLARITGR